jgi:hypothetical protein
MAFADRGCRFFDLGRGEGADEVEEHGENKTGLFRSSDLAVLRKDPLMKNYRAATQTLSAASSSTPAISVVSFTS